MASYYYDYAGRRVKKVVYGSPDVITKYAYDGQQVLCEYYEYEGYGDELKSVYIYGPGIDEPILFFDVFNSYYYLYHFDGLGNVAALTDGFDGNIVERYEYDVFGRCTVHTSPGVDGEWMTDDDITGTESAVGNTYMFTGRSLDAETGLYYYRARYYKPEIGRFLQPDPIGYADGLNMYTYCGNNPINFVDPFGFTSYFPGLEAIWQDDYIKPPVFVPDPGGFGGKGIIGIGLGIVGGSVILCATSPAWVTAGGVMAVVGAGLTFWDIFDSGKMLEEPPGSEAFEEYTDRVDDLIDDILKQERGNTGDKKCPPEEK